MIEVLGLLALFVLSFLGCSSLPVPLTATVLWLGQFDMPWWIIGIATVGNLIGWLCMEGFLRRWVLKRPHLARGIPVSYQKLFLRQTGFWLFVFNALPFPLEFMRFLALLNNYNRCRLTIIFTLARLCRNILLVFLGASLASHQAALWLLMGMLLVAPLLIQRIFQALPQPKEVGYAESR